MSKFLPCPFCGSDARLIEGGPGNAYVQCTGCKASTDDRSRERAVELWNRRDAQNKAAAREALEEAARDVRAGYPEGPRGLLDANYHRGLLLGTNSAVQRIRAMIARLDAEEPK